MGEEEEQLQHQITVNSPVQGESTNTNEGQEGKIEIKQQHNHQHHGGARILYRNKSSVKVGELNRYIITYRPSRASKEKGPNSLWLKVKNLEALPLRAAYLAGPYILYVDVTPEDYHKDQRSFSTGTQPIYEPQLKANQSFYAELFMNKLKNKYTWTVDVVSQIIFSTSASVQFELLIGHTKEDLHGSHHTTIPASIDGGGMRVQKFDTLDIWHTPTPRDDSPLHLVVITHGLHSNTGADMLYLKERIDETAKKTGENIIVRGYFDNVCRTERGIKYLGRRLGDYILKDLAPITPPQGTPAVSKISFIGHSLGGLIQTFAIAHIQAFEPNFFKRVQPVNFITLATPFLGISNENPGYVKFALDIGFAGKTGQDLGLTWKPSTKKAHKPLLQVLPTGPTHEALKLFRDRTLYANAVNDGIVPLRTSAILYLDWKALWKAAKAKRGEGSQGPVREDNNKQEGHDDNDAEEGQNSDDNDSSSDNGEAGVIPEDVATATNPNIRTNNNNHNNESDKSENKSNTPGDFFSSVTGPFNSLFSFLAPQAGGKRPGKIYRRSQTIHESEESGDSGGEVAPDANKEGHLPRKTSMLESGVSVLLPPLPPQSFITDPSSRPLTIFHDRVYSEDDLPPRTFRKANTTFNLGKQVSFASLTSNSTNTTNSASSPVDEEPQSAIASSPESGGKLVEKSKVEERIAREWHKNMKWRKILVELEPDAHNNIVVRRRFANAFGWPVIDHLVENHFGSSAHSEEKLKEASTEDLAAVVPYDIKKHGSVSGGKDHHEKDVTPIGILREANKSRVDRDRTPTEHDPEVLGQDLSSLTIDTSVPDEPPPPQQQQQSVSSSSDNQQPRSATSNNSLQSNNSNTAAWDAHLKSQDDSEDDGIVYSVGSWIDNIRNIGNYYYYNDEAEQSTSTANHEDNNRYHILETHPEEDLEGPFNA